MDRLKKEEQHVLNEKLKNIDESIQSLDKRSTHSYETASNKLEKISKYQKAKNKPYFGRIDIKENGKTDTLYIGEVGIEKNDSEIIVVDWRADIAQLFYSFHGGSNKLSYESNGQHYTVTIERKRQIGIENQRIVNVFETIGISEVPKTNKKLTKRQQIPNSSKVEKTEESQQPQLLYQDDFINKILSQKNDTHRLKNIIATIQIEQDEIIRKGIEKDIIVQGASGSGKSSIALHRISFLLYKYKDVLSPRNILILAPNKMFISFIQESLPHLDISGIKQSTFTEWAKEQFPNDKLIVKEPYETLAGLIEKDYQGFEDFEVVAAFKGSILFKEMIDRHLKEIETNLFPNEKKITINAEVSIDMHRIQNYFAGKQQLPLNQRIEDLRKYIEKEFSENVQRSIQEIEKQYDMIFNHWISELTEGSAERKSLFAKIDQIKSQKVKRTITEHLAVKKQILQIIKPLNAMSIYQNLFKLGILETLSPELNATLIEKVLKSTPNKVEISAEDVAPLLYIETLINGVKDRISYLIVDEAQDLSPLEAKILKMNSKSMTLLGDISQSIYSYKSINKWEELIPSVFNKEEVQQMNLEVSYRSTYEIMSLANNIVLNSELSLPLVTPIKRNGSKPLINKIENGKELFDNLRDSISTFREKGYSIIGIIGKDLQQTKLLYEYLLKYGEKSIQLITDSKQKLIAQIVVIPSYLVKGLEFDAVIIPNAGKDRFSNNVIDTKLLYVCVTRAQHDLHIYYHGELSNLLEMKDLILES